MENKLLWAEHYTENGHTYVALENVYKNRKEVYELKLISDAREEDGKMYVATCMALEKTKKKYSKYKFQGKLKYNSAFIRTEGHGVHTHIITLEIPENVKKKERCTYFISPVNGSKKFQEGYLGLFSREEFEDHPEMLEIVFDEFVKIMRGEEKIDIVDVNIK